MQKESDETSESEIEDDEEDFDVQVDLESNLQSVCRFPEELRSTHFIAIRLVLKKINHLVKITSNIFLQNNKSRNHQKSQINSRKYCSTRRSPQ